VLGEVAVRLDASVQCRRLSVTLNWRTHGKGNTDEGKGESLALFEGEWPAGQHRYPFRFMAPSAPATHHGQLVNVDHYVVARADIPWASDPKAEADILIDGGAAADFTSAMAKSVSPTDVRKAMGIIPNIAIGCGGFAALVCLVIMGVAMAASVRRGSGVGGILLDMLGTLPAPLFLVAGLFGVRWGIMRKMRAARLGEPEVTVEPLQPSVGGMVAVAIVINPKTDVVLEEASFDLVCTETATSGSGTNQTRHNHELLRIGQVLDAGGGTLPAGLPAHLKGRLAIPAGSPVSFASPNNRVAWTVQARVRVTGWPPWTAGVPLTVKA
jgi:hypothetical protein